MTPARAKTVLQMMELGVKQGGRTKHRSFARYICDGFGYSFKITEAEINELLNMRLIDIIILIVGEPEWVRKSVPPVVNPETVAAPSTSAPTAGRSRGESTNT